MASSDESGFLLHHVTGKCHGLKTMGPPIQVDVTLTRTMYLSTVADHVHQFMETVLPAGYGLFPF